MGYPSVIVGQKWRNAPRLTHDHGRRPVPGAVSYPNGGNVHPASRPGRPLATFDPQSLTRDLIPPHSGERLNLSLAIWIAYANARTRAAHGHN